MLSSSSLRRLGGFLLGLGLAWGPVAPPGLAAQEGTAERGFPLVTPVLPGLLEAGSQNFGIATDLDGRLLVANLSGLLTFDGAWWRLVPIGEGESAFSVAVDRTGQVAVGGIGELGLMAAGPEGTLVYRSLVDRLPAEVGEFGQVNAVVPTAQGFVFAVDRFLLVWDGAAFTIAGRYSGERPLTMPFDINGVVYVWSPGGLFRLQETQLVPVPGGEVFRGRRIDTLLPAEDGLLVSVRGEGLFRFRNGVAEPFAPEASRWTRASRVLTGSRLRDGRWALGSVVGGLLLLNPDGRVDQIIDSKSGLATDLVFEVAQDREGGLWLALDSGLARVAVSAPVTVIDRRHGLQGTGHHMARHAGRFWVGTSAGLFAVTSTAPMQLGPVEGLPPSIWFLLSRGEELLIATLNGVYVLGPTGGPELIPGTEGTTAYLLERSTADPERVWVGTEDGLGAVRREGGTWRYEGAVAGAPRVVRSLVEGVEGVAGAEGVEGADSLSGVLWCGSDVDGAWGLERPVPGDGHAVRKRVVQDGGAVFLRRTRGGILAMREGQLERLDEATATLVAVPGAEALEAPGKPGQFAEDSSGSLWLNSSPPIQATWNGRIWQRRELPELPARWVIEMITEPDGVVWMAAENGLYRVEGAAFDEVAPLLPTHVAQISLAGRRLFDGAGGGPPQAVELAPNVRRLRIDFGPLSFRSGLRYQTRLEPVDEEWSPPTAEPFAEITQLPRGNYTFSVRTLAPGAEPGPKNQWSFVVRPHWWETGWAAAMGLALALLGIRTYSGLRNRALRLRAAELEHRVGEQTEELSLKVAELRATQSRLEAANARLEDLSFQDALTGIANRRRLEQVMADEWARARRTRSFVGLVLLDLDRFKELNDHCGHLEGDQCLATIAAYLAGAVRRRLDLVARYGGEEFAVLLPTTDLAGATRVAEELRLGIEALNLRHPGVALGRVTASFGVAAQVPGPDDTHEALFAAADDAMYRAKEAGRNRVAA